MQVGSISPNVLTNSVNAHKQNFKRIKSVNSIDVISFTGDKENKSTSQSAGEIVAQKSQLLNIIKNIKDRKVQSNIQRIKSGISAKIPAGQQAPDVIKGDTKFFDYLYSPDKKVVTVSDEAIDAVAETCAGSVKAISVADALHKDVKKIFLETAKKLNLEEKHLPELTYTHTDARVLAYNGGNKLVINTLFLEKARNPVLLSSILLAHELSHKKTGVMLGMVDTNDIPAEYRPSTEKQAGEIEGMEYVRGTVGGFASNDSITEQEKAAFQNSPDYKVAVNYYKDFLDGLKAYYIEAEEYEKTPNDKVRADIIKILNLNNRDMLPISVEDLYDAEVVPDIKYDRLVMSAFNKDEIKEIEAKINDKMPQIKELLSKYDTKDLAESFKKFYKVYSDHIDERLSRYNEIKIVQENIKDGTIKIDDEELVSEFMALKPDDTMDKGLINLHRSSF